MTKIKILVRALLDSFPRSHDARVKDLCQLVGFPHQADKRSAVEAALQGDDSKPHSGFDDFLKGNIHFMDEVFPGFRDARLRVVRRNGGRGSEQLILDVGGASSIRQRLAYGNRP